MNAKTIFPALSLSIGLLALAPPAHCAESKAAVDQNGTVNVPSFDIPSSSYLIQSPHAEIAHVVER